MEALGDGHGNLLGGDAALDRLDHELGGVELLLAQHKLGQHGGADGAVAVGAVADLGAGDEGDEAVEEDDSPLPGAMTASPLPHPAAPPPTLHPPAALRLDPAHLL